jgi:hypothetical protein
MRLFSSPIALGLLAALVVTAALASPAAAEEVQADDGWRRTAYGWERIDQWHAPSVPRGGVSEHYVPPPPGEAPPFAIHPALLVFIQIAATGLAVTLLSPAGACNREKGRR